MHPPLEKNSQGVESVSFPFECLSVGSKHLSRNYQQPEAHLLKKYAHGRKEEGTGRKEHLDRKH